MPGGIESGGKTTVHGKGGFKFSAQLLGRKNVVKVMRRSQKRLMTNLYKALVRVLARLERTAKAEVPVDTGFLKGNIATKVLKANKTMVEGAVGTYKSVLYGFWVHEGHMAWGSFYVPPNRFLSRAFEKDKKWVHDVFKEAVFNDFIGWMASELRYRR